MAADGTKSLPRLLFVKMNEYGGIALRRYKKLNIYSKVSFLYTTYLRSAKLNYPLRTVRGRA